MKVDRELVSAKLMELCKGPVGGAVGVATALSIRKRFGLRKSEKRCPIARHLTAELGLEDGCVNVNCYDVDIFPTTDPDDIVTVDLPIACQDFVAQFDSGFYPYLDAPKPA